VVEKKGFRFQVSGVRCQGLNVKRKKNGPIYQIKDRERFSILSHPHPASPVEGEEFIFPPLAGGIEGGG
jgi:hypothetical protein